MGAKRQLLVTTAIGLVALPGTIKAADLITKAPLTPAAAIQYRWTGFYIGAHVGGAWGAGRGLDCEFNPGDASPCQDGTPSLTPVGVMGGGQIGYNWQAGNWLFGFEADISAMDVRDVAYFPTTDPRYASAEVGSRYDWLGTVRGRAGYAFDRSLFYATGGWAYARVSQHYFNPEGVSEATAGVRTGWTVGGGYEYAFANNWSVKAEYLYVDLQNSNVDVVFSTDPLVFTRLKFPNDLHIARVGLNYRF
jgi:outer membrane immunogenic protein